MSEVMIPPTAKSIGMSGRQGRKKQSLLTAARHNLRAIQAELGADSHIDASRICLNEILAGKGTPSGIDDLAQALRAGIGFIPKRKDYNQAHEFVFSLSSTTELDTTAFFKFCLEFVAVEFGQENILSAVIHRDEASPHCHILILPVAEGRYAGSELISKPSLAKIIERFAVAVLSKFKVRVMEKLAGKVRSEITQAVLGRLESTLAPHVGGELLDVILKLAGRNPAPFMAALSITLPASGEATGDGGAEFRRIALSAGKGGKTERNPKPNGIGRPVFDGESIPNGIGIEDDYATPKFRYQSCVVSADSPPPFHPTPAPRSEASGMGEGLKPGSSLSSATATLIEGGSNLSHPRPQQADTAEPDVIHRGAHTVRTPDPSRLKAITSNRDNPVELGEDEDYPNRVRVSNATPAARAMPAKGDIPNATLAARARPAAHLQDGVTSRDPGMTTRHRDNENENEVNHWDSDRGEFVVLTAARRPARSEPPVVGGRAAADQWVVKALAARSADLDHYRH